MKKFYIKFYLCLQLNSYLFLQNKILIIRNCYPIVSFFYSILYNFKLLFFSTKKFSYNNFYGKFIHNMPIFYQNFIYKRFGYIVNHKIKNRKFRKRFTKLKGWRFHKYHTYSEAFFFRFGWRNKFILNPNLINLFNKNTNNLLWNMLFFKKKASIILSPGFAKLRVLNLRFTLPHIFTNLFSLNIKIFIQKFFMFIFTFNFSILSFYNSIINWVNIDFNVINKYIFFSKITHLRRYIYNICNIDYIGTANKISYFYNKNKNRILNRCLFKPQKKILNKFFSWYNSKKYKSSFYKYIYPWDFFKSMIPSLINKSVFVRSKILLLYFFKHYKNLSFPILTFKRNIKLILKKVLKMINILQVLVNIIYINYCGNNVILYHYM